MREAIAQAPNYQPIVEDEVRYSRLARVVAPLAATLALLTACDKGESHHVENLSNGDTANSQQYDNASGRQFDNVEHNPNAPDIKDATVNLFLEDTYYTDKERVDYAWSLLDQPTAEPGYEGMTRLQAGNAKLRAENPLADPIVEPSLNMTGDQILANEVSIYNTAATTTELSDSDRAKILAAAIDNSNPVYQTVMENTLSRKPASMRAISEVATSAINHLPVESPIFKHTILNNGFDPKGIETKVMNVSFKQSLDGAKQKYYQFINDKPIQVYQCDSRDASVRASNPQNIPAY